SARRPAASGGTWPGRATLPSRSAERLLDRAGQEALDEVALERQEDDQRDRQRDERRRGDQVDVRAELAQLGEDRDRDRLGVAAEGECDQEVVPRPEELEDRERGDRRQPERQDDAGEDAELRGAVDARRFQELLRDPDEEVAQEEDRERQRERRGGEDQADRR